MADGIFISYKRGADSADARSLYSALHETFGGRVRMDIDSFPLGEDFVAHIKGELDKCQVVLVVIGRGFHERLDELQGDGDFMRLELEQALGAEGMKIIPVLFDGASMPLKAQLPDVVQNLVFRGALKVEHENAGIILRHKLIPDLKRIFEALPSEPEPVDVPEAAPTKPIATHLTREYLQDEDGSQAVTRMVKPQRATGEYPVGSEAAHKSPLGETVGEVASETNARVSWVVKFVAPVVLLFVSFGVGYATNSNFAVFVNGLFEKKRVSGLIEGRYQGYWTNNPHREWLIESFEFDGDHSLLMTRISKNGKLQVDDQGAYIGQGEPHEYVYETDGVFRSVEGYTLKVESDGQITWADHEGMNVTTYKLAE